MNVLGGKRIKIEIEFIFLFFFLKESSHHIFCLSLLNVFLHNVYFISKCFISFFCTCVFVLYTRFEYQNYNILEFYQYGIITNLWYGLEWYKTFMFFKNYQIHFFRELFLPGIWILSEQTYVFIVTSRSSDGIVCKQKCCVSKLMISS